MINDNGFWDTIRGVKEEMISLTNEVKYISKTLDNMSAMMEKELERTRTLEKQLTEHKGADEVMHERFEAHHEKLENHLRSHWQWVTLIVGASSAVIVIGKALAGLFK